MHPLLNPVAPYLLPVYYLWKISKIPNCVCGCRTWICLDITRFYEEQRQPFSGSATWLACTKYGKSGPYCVGAGGFDTICTAVCIRCDRSTACKLCRLEPSLSLPILLSHSCCCLPTPPCLFGGVLPYFEVTGQPVPVSSLGFMCPDCFICNCSYIFYPSKMKGPFRDNCLRYYYL